MIVYPNAKINLGLNILGKREDGYHELQSIFLPIGWSDILEIIPANRFSFSSSGLKIPGDPRNNLIVKAFELLRQTYQIPEVQIHLHKVIPMGAGLGGGSSDATFALKMLSQLSELNLSVETLESHASELGSDCPFFVKNQPTLVGGRGEILEPISLNLAKYWIEVICPKVHISTAQLFADLKQYSASQDLVGLIESRNWKAIKNDMESAAKYRHPQLDEISNYFERKGAVFSSMTGSGSAFFGLYESEPEHPELAMPFDSFVEKLK